MRGIEQIPWLYDGMMRIVEAFGLREWRRWLVEGASGLTLEVGCGTGRNLPLYPPDLPVVGLDPDPRLLAVARRRASRVPLVGGGAEALPFRDGTFDTVVSSLAFCTVPDPDRGLREIRRVLNPRGQLRMLEHVRDSRPFWARLQDRIQPLWTWVTGGCHPNRETEATVRAAGFVIDEGSREAQGTLRRFAARTRPNETTLR